MQGALEVIQRNNMCTLWFHDWDNWEDDRGEILKKTSYGGLSLIETEEVGFMLIQKRRCKRCKKIQLSNVKTK